MLVIGMVLIPGLVRAQDASRLQHKAEILGITPAELRDAYPELSGSGASPGFASSKGRSSTLAVPDIFNHGSVLDVGKLMMKVTNFGLLGNPFTNVSSDPSGQWPGQSGVEYLNAIALAVGAVNPTATDPNAIRRVSYFREWRPQTLDPEDRMYPSYDGAVNSIRFVDDDGDYRYDPLTGVSGIDEDFLDGRDNDNDGKIDEDYGALGQKMYSWTMWDNTIEAINFAQAEKHVPLGLECRQRAWAYSLSQYENFNVIEYEFINRSGHMLDSLVVGWLVDMDCGPVIESAYYSDDFDVPSYPSGRYIYQLSQTDARRQLNHDPTLAPQYPVGTALCAQETLTVNGFSISDDNGDEGKTPGVPSFLLFEHTIDPLGVTGPSKVGFRAFRSFVGGTPYTQGGNPTIDQQRFEFMTSQENIDPDPSSPTYGLIKVEAPGDQKGDYTEWCSVGPWFQVANNQSIHVTIGFAVARGNLLLANQYQSDYQAFASQSPLSMPEQANIMQKYPSVANAFAAQIAYEGIWEKRQTFINTTGHGRESEVCVPQGGITIYLGDCRDGDNLRQIAATQCAWFDFDCSYCTGVYEFATGTGLFHKTWNASAPPPNPILNTSVSYNFTDNPNREYVVAGNNQITLAWDNLSETSPDPSDRQELDFRGYKVWKVADWTRPVGSPGPADDEWQLLAEFRQFNYRNQQGQLIPNNRYLRYNAQNPAVPDTVCPRVWIPQANGGRGDSVDICLNAGDLWDKQSGAILRPNDVPLLRNKEGELVFGSGCVLGINTVPCTRDTIYQYTVGRYTYVDREVKNGFIYFYSVTAFDSTKSESGLTTELEGRRSAVEAEGVVPQTATAGAKGVWVVPNPYKGYSQPTSRPSSWDLTPNASDPTGTHVDFMGLPPGRWTIRIYTVSGDLVQELHSDDPVNESVRNPVTRDDGSTLPGYNRQQDNPNDGQARWNLISRNGQDVVSGIYMFTVDSSQGMQRGRFVVIR